MTLTDTGPLVAMVSRTDELHDDCIKAAKQLPPGPMLTTLPCLTEAMYLLHQSDGAVGQQTLWEMLAKEVVQLLDLTLADLFRMQELMERYSNVPMDFADASLLAVAESHDLKRLFTFDSDFRIYRLHDSSILELIP